VNWLNLDKLIESINLSGCTELIINKCDVLQTVGKYCVIFEGHHVEFYNMETMQDFINFHVSKQTEVTQVSFSGNRELINS